MQKTKQIAIILPDTLQSTGLQSLLTDYFPPVEIACFNSYESLISDGVEHFDYYFTQADVFVLNTDYFLPRRSKTVILLDKEIACPSSTGYYTLNIYDSQELIIEHLQEILVAETVHTTEKNKELSSRETDVLKLIVQGSTNKDIADKLHISLNTVLSHRKNITAKLGIKTVSGLTFYAIMNGLLPSDFIG
ncbi:DNA-binding CsgD family transcriptional regulator [Parabacteroides sp. PF5-5]|uniref:response regulator transcription factor n=1 Tax=unclassified Parabacteroides TaxID=2649774 RepID=UPI0024767CE2|nr:MULTISPECIES: LuxR C-terminal-related transcriptional regulator [unclassified Parabacteroides]MDH6305365.1 DNA-binding CsgD family transcriptional regulator [Parabacteroides sp. PH5-39]MDH6316718.1 DNA-binding CsgD family transcriptional regulator [Parabacteroides sp. PF5-13]MDH6320102.1 DNA-binding CsgD family transcriptional regulator [Parabacteroides sp. PH5-13]MDH6323955.1 DNA-binding CsgD family transcriptional regulator [Parabacteroides sp. PH5-8]MDH6327779.1 DNA-binding CsgD family t